MPELPHLILPKADYDLPRKKRRGFGSSPKRNSDSHGQVLGDELDQVLIDFRRVGRPKGIDPSLILRVQMSEGVAIDEAVWARNGLSLLCVNKDRSLLLFSSDHELQAFNERLSQYQGGAPEGQKSAPHSALFAGIDSISNVRPEDRIGRLFQWEGIRTVGQLQADNIYTVDIELWDLDPRSLVDRQIEEIRAFLQGRGGEVTDIYTGQSLILMRATCDGATLQEILTIESVANVDLPPQADVHVGDFLDLTLGDFAGTLNPPDDAPAITIFDTGIASAHPFIGPAIAEATAIPAGLGDGADQNGHGTRVGGIALYGEIEDSIANGAFVPELKLLSAKVLDKDGHFPKKTLVMTQMRDAIEYFNGKYSCRIFNISLGDRRLVFDDGKLSGWASVLDSLARELDLVIVVSAGNYKPSNGSRPDSIVTDYPGYLLSDDARLVEPATGSIVITVGSVVHSESLPADSVYGVELRPIAGLNHPSPFTRRGPGCGGAIKPEFCDYGGNGAFDGVTQQVRDDIAELSTITLSHEYLNQLFTTAVGTSYSAPRVAHAAARLLSFYPEATANLIRAFLAASARVPPEAKALLEHYGKEAVLNLCGYGKPNLEHAAWSDESRVVMYADAEIEHDNFHIFEIPVPELFVATKGERSITVSLAFDPPVRHTRIDYLGTKMSFRLIRGKSVNEVVEAFRNRKKDEEVVEAFESRFNCKMEPGPQAREAGTLQKATMTMKRAPSDYGDTYYLVVRCEKKWAHEADGPQRYAIVVQVEHSAEIDLYAHIQGRIQLPVRIRV